MGDIFKSIYFISKYDYTTDFSYFKLAYSLLGLVVYQIYLSFISTFDWKINVANQVGIWAYYFIRIILIIGYGKSSINKLYLSCV